MLCHRGRRKCSPPRNVKSNIRHHECAAAILIPYISGFVYCPIVKWHHVAPLGPPEEAKVQPRSISLLRICSTDPYCRLLFDGSTLLPVANLLLVEVDWCSQGFVLYLTHSPVSLRGTIVQVSLQRGTIVQVSLQRGTIVHARTGWPQ